MLVSETLLQRMTDPGDDFGPLVLAHEAAHLWFGCLVEGRWWDDLWLAEALATYLSYAAGEQVLGIDSPWRAFCMREQAAAYRADSLPEHPAGVLAGGECGRGAGPAGRHHVRQGRQRAPPARRAHRRRRAATGLRDYLTRYGGAATTLADLVGCWSRGQRPRPERVGGAVAAAHRA